MIKKYKDFSINEAKATEDEDPISNFDFIFQSFLTEYLSIHLLK